MISAVARQVLRARLEKNGFSKKKIKKIDIKNDYVDKTGECFMSVIIKQSKPQCHLHA